MLIVAMNTNFMDGMKMPKGEEKNMHKGSYSVKSVFHEYMLVIFTHTQREREIYRNAENVFVCV